MADSQAVRQALQGLTVEQQHQFLDELEKRQAAPARPEPVQEPGPIQNVLQGALQGALKARVPRLDMSTPPPADPSKGLGANLLEAATTTPEAMLETLPGRAAMVAAPFTGPAGGAAAAGLGEKIRQGVRGAAGLPKATGLTQSALGLDPNSREAELAGILGEAGTAGAAGVIGGAGDKLVSGAVNAGRQVSQALKGSPALAAFLIGVPRKMLQALGIATGGPAGFAKAQAASFALSKIAQSDAAKKLVLEAGDQATKGNISKAAKLFQGAASVFLAETQKQEMERKQQLGPMVEGR